MNKIGLKLWNINTDNYLKEAQKLYDKGVFDYIELYIVPDNTEKLAEWKKLNIPFDIHAPHYAHGMNLSKIELRQNNRKLYEEVRLYADKLNSEIIVFHGGSGGDYKETAIQLKSFNDTRILIENKPFKTLSFVKEPYYIGAKFEEIKYIKNIVKCGFCLDIGHCICAANSFKFEPYSYINRMLTLEPLKIHLSDLDIKTEIDMHLNYGLGNLNFEKLFTILPKDINITIETNKNNKNNLTDFENDINFLKRKIR